ncbi:MAG: DUF4398 domain-containing protein [Proteobacteria bacterium]|nr:DUF4398 domain-containing protein [Pseudomonadota bacterium]
MTPNWRKIHCAVLIAGLALTGCSPTRPPDIGLDDAAQAVAAARVAGAPTYAPLELRSAEDHLSQARALAEKRHYDDARRLLAEAQADSELAKVKARLGKLREQVDAATRENARLQQAAASGAAGGDGQ